MDNFFLLVIAVLFILLAGFLIFYFQTQQNFQEISEKLEIGESAVKMRVKRAKQKVICLYKEF